MLKLTAPVFLASKSPRRRKLLKQMGIDFKSFSIDLNEEIMDGEHPISTVKRLSDEKMKLALQKIETGIIITADTIVVLNKEIMGKPVSKKDAFRILSELSGKTHFVYTGFSIVNTVKKKSITDYVKTSVTFHQLTEKQIKDYIKTGSPMDKAGAYGIQDDYGAVFVKKISGCFYNVMGLPLSKIHNCLEQVN